MPDITISPGDIPTAAQINSNFLHTGGVWNAWVPVISQSTSPTFTTSYANYHRSGRLITFGLVITITSSAVAANDILISLPVNTSAALLAAHSLIGQGTIYDVSAGARYSGALFMNSVNTVKIADGLSTVVNRWQGSAGAGFAAALANGDIVSIAGSYEAAAG